MRRRAVTLAVSLLAAVAARADEPAGAPLAESKQALQALQTDEDAKNNAAAAGKLTDGLPRVPTAIPGAAPSTFVPRQKSSQSEKEQKRMKEAQKNWLLDGMDRLGRDNKEKKPTAAQDIGDGEGDNGEQVDGSEPDTLLKLYAERKKEDESKAQASQAAMTRRDPIAPFLQGWLSDSPARGRFFDEFAAKSAASADAAAVAAGSGSGSGYVPNEPAVITGPLRTYASTEQLNPYLAGLESLVRADPGAGAVGGTLTGPAALGAPALPLGPSPVDPLPAARPGEKKPPFLPPTDNEKYFPQLKKF